MSGPNLGLVAELILRALDRRQKRESAAQAPARERDAA